jgi:hypothetical protein
MESTEQSPDRPTTENDGEDTPEGGLGEVPQPATLPSDDSEEQDSEGDPDGSDEPEETEE